MKDLFRLFILDIKGHKIKLMLILMCLCLILKNEWKLIVHEKSLNIEYFVVVTVFSKSRRREILIKKYIAIHEEYFP